MIDPKKLSLNFPLSARTRKELESMREEGLSSNKDFYTAIWVDVRNSWLRAMIIYWAIQAVAWLLLGRIAITPFDLCVTFGWTFTCFIEYLSSCRWKKVGSDNGNASAFADLMLRMDNAVKTNPDMFKSFKLEPLQPSQFTVVTAEEDQRCNYCGQRLADPTQPCPVCKRTGDCYCDAPG